MLFPEAGSPGISFVSIVFVACPSGCNIDSMCMKVPLTIVLKETDLTVHCKYNIEDGVQGVSMGMRLEYHNSLSTINTFVSTYKHEHMTIEGFNHSQGDVKPKAVGWYRWHRLVNNAVG